MQHVTISNRNLFAYARPVSDCARAHTQTWRRKNITTEARTEVVTIARPYNTTTLIYNHHATTSEQMRFMALTTASPSIWSNSTLTVPAKVYNETVNINIIRNLTRVVCADVLNELQEAELWLLQANTRSRFNAR